MIRLVQTTRVHGHSYALALDLQMPLLDALREHPALTGTKTSCDRGQSGAHTVLVDNKRVFSCFVPAALRDGEMTAIDGLAGGVSRSNPCTRCSTPSRR